MLPIASQGFDAATYIVGPEEELPRRLECFTFVTHAPADYFYYRHAPHPRSCRGRRTYYNGFWPHQGRRIGYNRLRYINCHHG